MHRDLLDALRCPRDHEESWLVVVVHRALGVMLLDAELACPVCGAEFAVRGGVTTFDAEAVVEGAEVAPDAERLAALLGVTDGVLPILLAGAYAAAGASLAPLVPLAQVQANAPFVPRGDTDDVVGVTRMLVGARLPLGVATLAAAAVSARVATPSLLASVVRAMKAGGRIVAPIAVALPAGVRELARDDREWVGEVQAQGSGLVSLRRKGEDGVVRDG
jgi:uncharacterized protein YbaR (Trm112 family)